MLNLAIIALLILEAVVLVSMVVKLFKQKEVVAVLLTHGHYDHFSTLEKLLKEFDCPCYMHKKTPLKA